MSDSELSDAPSISVPSDAELEKSLRREVVKALKAGEDVSVNAIRVASQSILGLNEGFYANDTRWKAKSKEIIKEEHVCQP